MSAIGFKHEARHLVQTSRGLQLGGSLRANGIGLGAAHLDLKRKAADGEARTIIVAAGLGLARPPAVDDGRDLAGGVGPRSVNCSGALLYSWRLPPSICTPRRSQARARPEVNLWMSPVESLSVK